ncbi:hypothetical protein N7492_000282 [Penicillium capsulatum]|uniref:NAD(P)-binding domain-containing protein n=1 Tax=Penicillium capsulatum TaxID=69766 RepID=A0A9W9LYE3_9EURO|nr:hypothetical protein N7492_000282 [Penicillium capsulatum]KAJ6130653.1 hypothetical protein N7512_003433 [Penicillium capsulatum]
MSSTTAFFGATGGCTSACLAHTLRNGYNAIALARTPSKLTTQMLEQPGVTQDHLDQHLRIVQGDATNVEAVIKTLIDSEDSTGPTLVSRIISGLGGTPAMSYTQPSPCDKMKMRVPALPHLELDNPNITEQATRTLLQALQQIAARFPSFQDYAAVAPRVTIISTTGIREGPSDVPFWFRGMYHTLLAQPHQDKLQMEKLVNAEGAKKESLLCGGLVLVRPSLLTGDHRIVAADQDSGYAKMRVGTDQEPQSGIGYTIPKPLVGEWIYKELVKGNGDQWVGNGVLLTC